MSHASASASAETAQRTPALGPNAGRAFDIVVTVLAAVCLVGGSAIIGHARVIIGDYFYISELGAQGMRTEAQFQVGFLLVVAGIALVAVVVRDVRTSVRLLHRWSPAVSLFAAALLFLVAALVPCSTGCPTPIAADAQVRDWVHIVAAVLGFAAGCTAMLQFAASRDRWLARLSIVGGLAVAIIAAIGGLISLARANTDLGSSLEFVAAGIGVLWLLAVAIVHAVPRAHDDEQIRGDARCDLLATAHDESERATRV